MFNEIQLTHDNFIKYSLNIQKNSNSLVSKNEAGKFPLSTKIWSQMVKYFLWLSQRIKSKIIDNALDCAI